jgi:hypothetical protein
MVNIDKIAECCVAAESGKHYKLVEAINIIQQELNALTANTQYPIILNGFDVTPYLAEMGHTSQRNDIDHPDTGRMDDTILRRVRGNIFETKTLISKSGENVGLTVPELTAICQAVKPQVFDVEYYNFEEGRVVVDEMMSNRVKRTENKGGIWDGVEIPLVATGIRKR